MWLTNTFLGKDVSFGVRQFWGSSVYIFIPIDVGLYPCICNRSMKQVASTDQDVLANSKKSEIHDKWTIKRSIWRYYFLVNKRLTCLYINCLIFYEHLWTVWYPQRKVIFWHWALCYGFPFAKVAVIHLYTQI